MRVFLIMLMVLIQRYPQSKIDSFYPECGIVIAVDYYEGHEAWDSKVTFQTGNGNMFSYWGGEDMEVGDVIACIMDDKGTPEVSDDEVISVRYCSPVNVIITD